MNQDNNNLNQSNYNINNNNQPNVDLHFQNGIQSSNSYNNLNEQENNLNQNDNKNDWNNSQSNIDKSIQNEAQNLNSSNNLNNQNNNNVSKGENNSKFKKIIKKIFIVLTIIVAIIGCGISAFSIFTSFTMESIEFFGPLPNIFVFFGGIVFLIYTAIIIAIIWIIYGIINLLYKFYNILNAKHKKIFKFALISLLLIIIIFSISLNKYNYNNKNLAEVLNEPPNYEFYDTTSYYFIHNDKIYYYVLDNNSNYTELYDRLFVMNLDGTENKKLAETDELRYATFYFVYNNEAYYYTMYYNENKKINLSTGEITSLGNDDIYISKTLTNGKVNTFIDHAIAGNAYSIFKKVDLTTNKTISEIKTMHSMAGNEYYLDYDGGNIYYLEDFYSEYPTIYKNTNVIYQFVDEKNKKVEFIAVNEDYLYFKSENHIYKLNINTKEIETEVYYNLGDIHRISSGNNSDNYFYINGKIYEFDLTNDKFNLVLSDIKNEPEYVYNINNKLIFTENTDNLKYNTSNDNLGSVVVYDISSKDIEKFDGIRKVCFDENYMYLLINSTENYVVQKYELNS